MQLGQKITTPNIRGKMTISLIEHLLSAYIINLPQKQLQPQRIMIHLRDAYYHYLLKNNLPDHSNFKRNLQELAFHKVLNEYLPQSCRLFADQLEESFNNHTKIPVFGAIVSVNTVSKGRRILLIQDRRTKKYGVPKGKLRQGQSQQQCAQRETMQQTGLRIKCTKKYVQLQNEIYKRYRLYHASLVNHKHLCLQTICQGYYYREQISKILWLTLEEIQKIVGKLNGLTKMVFVKEGIIKR